jgi:hypothetical protein
MHSAQLRSPAITIDRKAEVSFAEHAAGGSPAPEVFLGASDSRDNRRIARHRALIVFPHRESEIP